MSIIKWGEKVIHKFNVWDITFFKAYLFFLGLIVGAYFNQFIIDYIWDFVFIVIVSAGWIFYKLFIYTSNK